MRGLGEEGCGEEEEEARFMPPRCGVMKQGPMSAISAAGLGTLRKEIAEWD